MTESKQMRGKKKGIKTTRVPATVCPGCGYKLDAASSMDGGDHTPQPGSPTLCLKCGELLIFDESLKPRSPSAAELIELQCNPVWRDVQRHRRALLAFQKEFGKPR
jgi:hypothetical protein